VRRGEFHEHFAGEGVVAHVEVRDVDRELVGVVTSGDPDDEPPYCPDPVVVGGSAHVDTLRNRHPGPQADTRSGIQVSTSCASGRSN